MRISLQEFCQDIYCIITVFLFFFPLLLAELVEYVLKDQQEKQVEDIFGKIDMARTSFLHDSVLANMCFIPPVWALVKFLHLWCIFLCP